MKNAKGSSTYERQKCYALADGTILLVRGTFRTMKLQSEPDGGYPLEEFGRLILEGESLSSPAPSAAGATLGVDAGDDDAGDDDNDSQGSALTDGSSPDQDDQDSDGDGSAANTALDPSEDDGYLNDTSPLSKEHVAQFAQSLTTDGPSERAKMEKAKDQKGRDQPSAPAKAAATSPSTSTAPDAQSQVDPQLTGGGGVGGGGSNDSVSSSGAGSTNTALSRLLGEATAIQKQASKSPAPKPAVDVKKHLNSVLHMKDRGKAWTEELGDTFSPEWRLMKVEYTNSTIQLKQTDGTLFSEAGLIKDKDGVYTAADVTGKTTKTIPFANLPVKGFSVKSPSAEELALLDKAGLNFPPPLLASLVSLTMSVRRPVSHGARPSGAKNTPRKASGAKKPANPKGKP